MNTAEFSPINSLEKMMVSARAGQASQLEMVTELVNSQVVVLLNQDIPESGWHEDILLLKLMNPAGDPMLAVFTALERAIPWSGGESEFKFAIHTEFSWLLHRIAPELGIAVNPGGALGFEVPALSVAELKSEFISSLM